MSGVPRVLAIDGVVRDYAWGSTTAIQAMLGVEPDGRPAAELWFGAHPDDPAGVPSRGTTLDELIDADPVGMLGADVAEWFGPRLPFLVKVLAAAKPLSIQVHPTIEQARAGFAAEDAAGIARDSPQRNYRDTNHKPELLCALTEFEALCGFRPVEDTLRLLQAFALTELAPVRELLQGEDSLRAAFSYLLTMPEPGPLAVAVAARADAITDGEWTGVAAAVRHAAREFPGDVGIALALLLNHVRLEPGEAIYLGAGNVHAYLCGLGVEIMANSDNVLRCGLTPKHVDVDELLEITDFTPLAEPRWPDSQLGVGVSFEVPVPDFRLSVLHLDEVDGSCAVGDQGPCIALCTDGHVRVERAAHAVELIAGHAAFAPAHSQALRVSGSGTVFVATVG